MPDDPHAGDPDGPARRPEDGGPPLDSSPHAAAPLPSRSSRRSTKQGRRTPRDRGQVEPSPDDAAARAGNRLRQAIDALSDSTLGPWLGARTTVALDAAPDLERAIPLLATGASSALRIVSSGLAAPLLARRGVPLDALVVLSAADAAALVDLERQDSPTDQSLLVIARSLADGLASADLGRFAAVLRLDDGPDSATPGSSNGSFASELHEASSSVAAIALGTRLGADPLILVGMRPHALDGVTLVRGTPLDDEWAAALNPFSTIELLEWRRHQESAAHPAALRELLEAVRLAAQRTRVLRHRCGLPHSPGLRGVAQISLATMRRSAGPRVPRSIGGSGERGVARGEHGDSAAPPRRLHEATSPGAVVTVSQRGRIAAIVPIEPHQGGLGTPRSLDSRFAGRSVLQRTLERLGMSAIDEIVVVAPDDFDAEALIDRRAVRKPVVIERCGASVFTSRQEAVIAARLWSDTSFASGIAGMSIFDEIFDPQVIAPVVARRGLDAIVLCGPDWPLVDVSRATGIDALLAAHLGDPAARPLVTTPAPPGLASAILSRALVESMAEGRGPASLGALLRSRDELLRLIPVDFRLARSLVRATFDTPRYKLRLRRAVEPLVFNTDATIEALAGGGLQSAQCVGAIEHQWLQLPTFTPPHLMVELCTGRFGSGACSPHRLGSIQRVPLSLRLAERLFAQCGECRDAVVTLGGIGDPLRHPDLERIVALARKGGVRGVHLRTELIAPREQLERLLASDIDVISVDLHADSPETARRTMGVDRFQHVISNIEYLRDNRRRLGGGVGGGPGGGQFALPWIVPRIQRRPETLHEIGAFHTRWTNAVGSCLIEGTPPLSSVASVSPALAGAAGGHGLWGSSRSEEDRRLRSSAAVGSTDIATTIDSEVAALASCEPPARAMIREGLRRLTMLSDGSVPISELDLLGEGDSIGNLSEVKLIDTWRELFATRRRLRRQLGENADLLRTIGP